MTSKHCFFRYMKEDFKHKSWMLVLSVLGNAMALPIAFLMFMGRMTDSLAGNPDQAAKYAFRVMKNDIAFFEDYMLITGGIIAVCGAFIVGLASFRYLHNKKMTDTYESIPMSRSKRFAAGYINGVLIWLVPYLVCQIITLIMGVGKYYRAYGEWNALSEAGRLKLGVTTLPAVGDIFKGALIATVVLVLVYLLLFHFILVAECITGNILNTLVVLGVAGVESIVLYACLAISGQYYLHTYYDGGMNDFWGKLSVCLSPAALLFQLFYQGLEQHIATMLYPIAAVLMTIVLGVAAFILFKRRASELAEQGTKNTALRMIIQYVVAGISGTLGWYIFGALVGATQENTNLIWNIFGAVLTSVLAFGVLDIIFSMEFKAFFHHWKNMVAAVLLPIVICVFYCFDVFGYDTYLPKESDIESIVVGDSSYSIYSWNNFFFLDEEEDGLGELAEEKLEYRNQAVIYRFLQDAVKQTRENYEKTQAEEWSEVTSCDAYPETVKDPEEAYSTMFTTYVKVKLKNGRSYRRKYTISSGADNEAYRQILASEEYIRRAYCVPESMLSYIDEVDISGDGVRLDVFPETEAPKGKYVSLDVIQKIVKAYNQDVLQHSELLFGHEGHAVTEIVLYVKKENDLDRYGLNLYEEMENVMQVLRENNLEMFTHRVDVEGIERFEIETEWWYDPDENSDEASEEEFINRICRRFGISYDRNRPLDVEAVKKQMQNDLLINWNEFGGDKGVSLRLDVKNPEDIAYLYDHSRMESSYLYGVFNANSGLPYCYATDFMEETHVYILDQGTLPAKYVDYLRVLWKMVYGK